MPAVVLAFVLEHRDPALALAGILALAVVLGALTGALAGAAIDAEAASRAVPETTIAAAVIASLAPDFWVSFIFLSCA